MVDYELARPNETKLTFYLEECNTDWKAVALNLLAWFSDDDVKEGKFNHFDIMIEPNSY